MIILPIKKKWFGMILSREKREEYREIKPYYKSRFCKAGMIDKYGLPTLRTAEIIFRNGYSAKSPSFKAICSLDIKTGREEWGAEPGVKYYVLTIKKIQNLDWRENENMRELKQYVCDVCGTIYKDRATCKECESGHVKPLEISGATWVSMKNNGSGYPTKIHVGMSNGETITYSR